MPEPPTPRPLTARQRRGAGRHAAATLLCCLLAMLAAACTGPGDAPPAASGAATAVPPSPTSAPTATPAPPPAAPSETVAPPPPPAPTAPPTAEAAPPPTVVPSPPPPAATAPPTAEAAPPPTVAAAPPASPPALSPQAPMGDEAAAREAVDLINTRRAEAGCPAPLTPDGALTRAAERHSRDMAANDVMDHTGSDGSDPGQRIAEAGYRWGPAAPGEPLWAENVAAGYESAAAVVEAWMTSEGHRENMLTCSFRAVGLAVARRPGTTYGTYWTAVFASAPAP